VDILVTHRVSTPAFVGEETDTADPRRTHIVCRVWFTWTVIGRGSPVVLGRPDPVLKTRATEETPTAGETDALWARRS